MPQSVLATKRDEGKDGGGAAVAVATDGAALSQLLSAVIGGARPS
jgi:hypothetical protein